MGAVKEYAIIYKNIEQAREILARASVACRELKVTDMKREIADAVAILEGCA
jgi:hypothetical protein